MPHDQRLSAPERHQSRVAERAARRESYLEAAVAVIHSEGPQASMDAIASAAGVSKPILYRHFGDRDGLVAAIAERFGAHLISEVETAMRTAPTGARQLHDAVDAYIRAIEEDPPLYRYLTRRTLASNPTLTDVVDRIATSLARLLGEQMRGLGADSRAAETWAYGIVGMVHLAGDQWVAHPSIPRERLIDDLVALLWRGLAGMGPR